MPCAKLRLSLNSATLRLRVGRPVLPDATLRLSRSKAILIASAAVVAGCVGAPATADSGKLIVVTTTTVFADIVSNVGGDLVSVTSFVPKNADVHTFEPRPADIRIVSSARLLVMNGLGLDDWLAKTIANASAEGTPLVKLGVDLPGVTLLTGKHLFGNHLANFQAHPPRTLPEHGM